MARRRHRPASPASRGWRCSTRPSRRGPADRRPGAARLRRAARTGARRHAARVAPRPGAGPARRAAGAERRRATPAASAGAPVPGGPASGAARAGPRRVSAAVLGHDRRRRVEPDRAFKELGFDSLDRGGAAQPAQRGHRAAAAATLVFDHPTPAGWPATCVAELLGPDADGCADGRTGRRCLRRADRDRRDGLPLPGRCELPGGPVGAGRDGGDAIGDVPRPTAAGTSTPSTTPTPTTRGTIVRPARRLPPRRRRSSTPSSSGSAPREAAGHGPAAAAAAGDRWEAFERAGHRPGLARRAAGPACSPASCPTTTRARLQEAPEAMEGYLAAGSTVSVASGRVAYTFGLRGRPSPSTPPAPPRWSPCTWRRRRCGAASARWRWPAA